MTTALRAKSVSWGGCVYFQIEEMLVGCAFSEGRVDDFFAAGGMTAQAGFF